MGRLCKKHTARLLYLSDSQSLDVYLEQIYLYTFPFPAFLFLTVIEFNVLHSLYQLDNFVLFIGGLIKTLEIKFTSVFHEIQDP